MNNRQIVLKKVKVNNLKDIDLTLNHNELIVITGLSGSGKSSLAFDTIFIEGQRRYIESLSHADKHFLKEQKKPDFQEITGLSPTIAIEQKGFSKNPRSTIGTISGIYDYLRVIYAKIGIPHCPISGSVVKPRSKDQIFESLKNLERDKKIFILSPFAKNKKASFKEEIKDLIKKGFIRVRIDETIYDLSEISSLDPKKAHNVDIVIDRLILTTENFSRLKDAIYSALEIGNGFFSILDADTNEENFFSELSYCPKSKKSYPSLKPSNFSFNHPDGMCLKCQGIGEIFEFDLQKIIDEEKSIEEDCCSIAPHYNTVRYKNIYKNLAKIYDFSVDTAWKNLPKKAKDIFLYGADKKWL